MKAVMPSVPREILEWRKRSGADRWDEMWEGVLHMPPMPNPDHQELEWALETYLRKHWARPNRGKVYHNINLAAPGGWRKSWKNYRIPDLVLITRSSNAIRRKDYFEGPPDVVVEIESPGDETREKLDFFASLGVPEVWILDRDSKVPEVHVLEEGSYEEKPAGKDGWILSEVTGIELRAVKAGKLGIRIAGDNSTREDLPED